MPYLVTIDGAENEISLNCKKMFDWAIGKPLETLHNKTGREAYHDLWPAVAQIYRPDDYETLLKLEPKNGYGTVDEARQFLFELMKLASENPDEVFLVQGHKS